ncbi:MAG TPA: carbohydrate kinase [Clostridiales bacterium UBA8960]|nr:carbohydrate kinase [Clostridiales bacterium UBA8960]
MNKVLCIGELLMFFIGGEKDVNLAHQQAFMMKAGGAPANVACVVGALGGESMFYGAVGRDGFGDFLADTLKRFKVDTSNLIRSIKPTTLAFVSVAKNGARDFVFVRGADADLELTDLDVKSYEATKIVHFGAATAFLDGHLNRTYHQLLINALADDKCVSFDPNYRSAFWEMDQKGFVERVMPFIEKAHLIKLSDEEAFLISGLNDIEMAKVFFKSRFDGTFAITLGDKGVDLFNKEWSVHVPAIDVEVKDTTGAGDAFVGALLYSLSYSQKPLETLKDQSIMKEFARIANDVAASVCTEYGALTALARL